MKTMSTKMKVLNIFLLILIVIGIVLLSTQDKWVNPLVNYILKKEGREAPQVVSSRWTGKINSVSTDCFFDGECSVTVSDVKVIVNLGDVEIQNIKMGKLLGVESISDVKKYIGKNASVYARKINNSIFTLEGNEDYFVEILK